jgi:Na+/alanine symporter
MIDLFNFIETIINQIIAPLNWVMLFLIIGGGIYLTIISRANPLMRMVSGFKLMLRKDTSKIGISRFQALSAVLAATVGLGLYFLISSADKIDGVNIKPPIPIEDLNHSRLDCI